MTGFRVSSTGDRGAERRATVVGTLPLGILTGALFLASYVVYEEYPNIGPGNYPLWGLFLTLGFVAAIGTVVSWFFAADEPKDSVSAPEKERAEPADDSKYTRAEFGRPAPEVAPSRSSPAPSGSPALAIAPAAASVAPWDEDVLPPPVVRGPRPVLTTPYDPGDIGRALEEIEDIQRELASRRPMTSPDAEATGPA